MANHHLFSTEPEWVTEDIIRTKFNDSQMDDKVKSGEFQRRLFGDDNHLTAYQRRKIKEPKCTRSQMVLYSNLEGQPVALVHQYKRKNGDLGGSGSRDPKRLFIDGKVLAIRQAR